MDTAPAHQARRSEGNEKSDAVDDDGHSRAVEHHGSEVAIVTMDDCSQVSATMDAAAESRIRLKMDWCLMPLLSLIYLLAFIDRSNIGNAKLAGLEKDLGMGGYDYNTALSIFYISYILFEIPLMTLCKWIGPGRFIPASSLAFGICTIGTAFVRDFSALCGLRFLLGIFEAAMMPGIVYFLSRWYRRSELTFRIALFIVSASLAGAFGGLLASAILRIPSFGSLHSWRIIFAIEGIATCVLSIVSFILLPDRPESARWLSAEEKELAVARLRTERIGTANLIDKSSWNKLKLGICNPVVLSTSLIFLLNSITVHGISFFLPTIVRTIYPDRSVQTQQLLTVPPYVVGAVACIAISFCSWKLDRRGVFLIFCCPPTVVGYAMLLASSSPTVRYGATFLPFIGIFSYGSLTNSHVSANVVSDTARSSAVATNAMMGNIGGLISTWAFLEFDAPRFSIGNGLNLAAQASMFFIALALYLWIERDNKKRRMLHSTVENSTTESSQEVEDMDWKHPGFRWHN
ncbi:hypothetical protein G6O67_006814 [Ophiocordyceps sinensis]|uniref:Major facilitator superfamily (MFS) profile domain-containing protein n=1 Tax=Ophiocordyceps sinensis TaxID=72228 RepID=A0A8H4LX17_9HYPO|nr:hypothetical protein G6O67_006814 [Ophiocordyceps sinensis]